MPFTLHVLLIASILGETSALDGPGCSSDIDVTQRSSDVDDTQLLSILTRRSVENHTDTTAHAENQQSETSLLLTNVRDLARKAGRGELPIDNATRLILDGMDAQMDNLLRSALISHAENQAEANATRDNIAACGAKAETDHTESGGIDELKSKMDQNEDAHSTCRVDEKAKLQAATADCNIFQDYGHELSPPSCMASFPTGPSVAAWDCIDENKRWADAAHAAYSQKHQACVDATALLISAKSSCNIDQGRFESSVCSHALELTKVCRDQAQCRTTATEARSEAHSRIAIAETARKSEFKAAKIIKCYMRVLRSSGDAQADSATACESLAPDTKELDIFYPPVPDPASCDPSPAAQKPCDSAWVESKYDEQKGWYDFTQQNRYTNTTDKVLPQTCIPCVASVVAPTVAPMDAPTLASTDAPTVATINAPTLAPEAYLPFSFTTLNGQYATSPTSTSAYAGSSLDGSVTLQQGIQEWTVPASGLYEISALGASTEKGTIMPSKGRGASVTGEFQLVKGESLRIIVGQMGNFWNTGDGGSGGGGASWVWIHNQQEPLVVAGGAGGSRETRVDGLQNGYSKATCLDGRLLLNPKTENCNNDEQGGWSYGAHCDGGGGAGWNRDGDTGGEGAKGGLKPDHSTSPGAGGNSGGCGGYGPGGFGGGGAAGYDAGGGGGGYIGGDGGTYSGKPSNLPGTGGSSYVHTSALTSSAGLTWADANGAVVVTLKASS